MVERVLKRQGRERVGNRSGSDSSTFLRRALLLQGELQKRRFPNASTLAELCGCSRSTAMRTIDRLRYEFGVPIEYDESHRGYYLTKSDFAFSALPPDRQELIAILLLSELASMVSDRSLQAAISSLWARMTNGRADVERELSKVKARFSVEPSKVAKTDEVDLVSLLTWAHRGQLLSFKYLPPWGDGAEVEYAGCFERVHFSEGLLYALLKEADGKRRVLNVSFIRDVSEISQVPDAVRNRGTEQGREPYWLEGLGAWSGELVETIEVTLAPPAARYYSAQTWHARQEDSWCGDRLIRRFPGVVTPELSRRILGLGRFVESVRPESLLRQLQHDVKKLAALCEEVDSRVVERVAKG
jgi:predicted DNA-binding transcriptional regulator YafY